MRLGVLTSGGDSPGMNAAIRAVVKVGNYYDIEVIGIKRGYQGILDGDVETLTCSVVDGIAEKGGTILKTARCMEFMDKAGRERAVESLKKLNIDALVVIGGNGSFMGAEKLHKLGVKVIGIPGTIDNDLAYTDYSIGFDTTLNTVLDCISKIKDTDSSHDKTTVVEVMGRYCGDLALYSALAGGGEIISTPEKKMDFDTICAQLNSRISSGKKDSIVIITERMYELDELQNYVEEKLNISIRTTALGFVQRGGKPSAFDRVLASKMGRAAVQLLINGHSGRAIGIKNNKIIDIEFEKVETAIVDKKDNYDILDMLL